MTGATNPSHRLAQTVVALGGGIGVMIGDIEAIDPATRTVTVGGRQITAEHLIVSLGADDATDTIPGLQQAGETFATLSGAERLAPAVNAVTKGRVLVVTAAPRYRCPAAPYEAALLIDAALGHQGVRENVDVALHAAEPAPMGVAGAHVSEAVTAILTDRNIDYRQRSRSSSTSCGDGCEHRHTR